MYFCRNNKRVKQRRKGRKDVFKIKNVFYSSFIFALSAPLRETNMAKHTLEISYDYDFLLIGISSHEKDYRICWALNKKLGIDLVKQDSLEIKGKKQTTPSYFSFFIFDKEEDFLEYSVIANFSENKALVTKENTLFNEDDTSKKDQSENELLIPEQKQMNYFFMVRGEVDDDEAEELVKSIKEIDVVQTAIRIDVTQLKSKQNLIF